MRTPTRKWTVRFAAGAFVTGAAVVACYNEVPGPQGPLPAPSREAPKQGPTPGPILPIARLAPEPDAGFAGIPTAPVPPANPAQLAVPMGAEPSPPPPTGSNTPADAGAGPDTPADLPAEVPDAGRVVTTDAGQPLGMK